MSNGRDRSRTSRQARRFFRTVLDKPRLIPTIFSLWSLRPLIFNPQQNNLSTFIPLISSGTAGPLGVLHLPRFWQKASLEARGKLDSRYPGCGGGYDMMTLNALGLNKDATLKFIKDSRPTYPQLEAWIKKQPGVKLDQATVAKHNASVLGYNHDDATRQGILKNNGLPDDATAVKDAVHLNDLDSWQEFHADVLK